MLKISDAVKNIIETDDVALAALKRGFINFSSYAREISPLVADITKKDVDDKSIVVALSRYQQSQTKQSGPENYEFYALSVHSNLVETTYERTQETFQIIQDIYKELNMDNKMFVTVTLGITEITIIANRDTIKVFHDRLKRARVIYHNENLSGVAVKFDISYLDIPGLVAYATRKLALKNVNIIEVISTTTELTYIVEKKDVSVCLGQLGSHL